MVYYEHRLSHFVLLLNSHIDAEFYHVNYVYFISAAAEKKLAEEIALKRTQEEARGICRVSPFHFVVLLHSHYILWFVLHHFVFSGGRKVPR